MNGLSGSSSFRNSLTCLIILNSRRFGCRSSRIPASLPHPLLQNHPSRKWGGCPCERLQNRRVHCNQHLSPGGMNKVDSKLFSAKASQKLVVAIELAMVPSTPGHMDDLAERWNCSILQCPVWKRLGVREYEAKGQVVKCQLICYATMPLRVARKHVCGLDKCVDVQFYSTTSNLAVDPLFLASGTLFLSTCLKHTMLLSL